MREKIPLTIPGNLKNYEEINIGVISEISNYILYLSTIYMRMRGEILRITSYVSIYAAKKNYIPFLYLITI